MRHKIQYVITFVLLMFVFVTKTNAWAGLCLYGTDKNDFNSSKETALVQIEDATREIWFSNEEVASWDTTSWRDGVFSILNFYKFAGFKGGTYIRFQAGYDSAYIWNGNNDGNSFNRWKDTVVPLYWGLEGNDNLLKRKFVDEYRCPEVIIYDGDSLIEINQDLNLTFSDDRDVDESGNGIVNLLNNHVFFKYYDLVEDSFKSDEMYAADTNLISSLDNGTCSVTQEQVDKIKDAFTFNFAGTYTDVTRYLIAQSLKKDGTSYGNQFDYTGLANKVLEYNNNGQTAEDYLINTCSLDAKGLTKSANTFLGYLSNGNAFPNADSIHTCAGMIGDPDDKDSFAYYLQIIFDTIQYAGIAACIILTIFDGVKTITADDKDDINGLIKRSITRLIFAGLIFFIPMIVELALKIFHIYGDCGIH